MSSMIDTTSYGMMSSQAVTDNYAAEALQNKISRTDAQTATDDELMEACKSFETYFVEQVIKEMKKTVKSEEEEGEYMQYFGDTLYEQYASAITESGQLGIAKTLYDSMKTNTVNPLTLTDTE